jgi:ankyrin repeat protein
VTGNTLLHIAAVNGHKRIAKELLRHAQHLDVWAGAALARLPSPPLLRLPQTAARMCRREMNKLFCRLTFRDYL